MAISGSYNLQGITIPTAYARVEGIMGDKLAGFSGQLALYATVENSQSTDENRPQPIFTINISERTAPGEANPYPGLYANAKAMSGFENFEDVMENSTE